MVKLANPLGTVLISSDYFANLVGYHASSCYGVIGMATSNAVEGIRAVLFGKNFPEKGVRVREKDGNLFIDIHIRVMYGINISAIVESISEKVKYVVEQATDLYVHTVNVYVDEMSAE
jgi:uncharacterized alkaline shock family protein YloU